MSKEFYIAYIAYIARNRPVLKAVYGHEITLYRSEKYNICLILKIILSQ